MEQIVLHFIGDFLLQNNWMAKNKAGFHFIGWAACFVHCFIYALPFLFYLSITGVSLVFLTHFVIDKFRVAYYWTIFFKIDKNEPENKELSFFLVFLVDIALHFATNFFIFQYFYKTL
jgi:hypothetical protein